MLPLVLFVGLKYPVKNFIRNFEFRIQNSEFRIQNSEKVLKVHLRQIIFQSNFSGPRLYTLRYQQFQIQRVEAKIGNVSRVYYSIHESILKDQCSTYE